MKLLVTGGADFIGGNFVHYILKKYSEDTVVCLDVLTYAGNMETLSDVTEKPRFQFIKGDISDRNTVFSLFEREKADVVVNSAAERHMDRSIEDPALFCIPISSAPAY